MCAYLVLPTRPFCCTSSESQPVYVGPSDKTALQELVTEALLMKRVGSDENVLKLLGVCTLGGKLFQLDLCNRKSE